VGKTETSRKNKGCRQWEKQNSWETRERKHKGEEEKQLVQGRASSIITTKAKQTTVVPGGTQKMSLCNKRNREADGE
jgi:hypothetical protein